MANDQKKINNGILKDLDFYHTLLDSITDGVFVLNRDWEYILVNQKAADLVKMTIEQLLNHKITTLFPGIEETKFYRFYEQVMKEKKIERIIDEFVHPNGSKGYYEVTVYPVPEGILCISRDITDSKTIEEELLKEKLFTETALNTQQDTFFIFEISTGKALRWNNAFRDISGYSDQEISTMKAPDSYYSEEDLKKAEENIETTLNESISNTEISLITKSGKKIPFEYYTSIMKDSEGNPIYIVSIGRDITERKQVEDNLRESEEKFRTITEQSLMGIAILQDNIVKYVSQKLADIYGYSVEEILNFEPNGFLKLIHPDFVELVIEQARKKQAGFKGVITNYQLKSVKKTGENFWVENYSKTINYNGRPADLTTIIDINERKKAEEELKKSEENYRNAFERAELYKDLFAHDISNMLQNIKSSVGLFSVLRNRPEQLEKLDEIMEVINDQIIRGSNLVSNIRKLSQVSENESILEKVNLNTELQKAVKFIHESYPNKDLDIKIKSNLQDEVVKADALLLDVFENILFNAIKYNENPSIEILIRISKELKNETKYLKLEFLDNGIGISDNMKEKIFEGTTTQKNRTKGMGLGLLLVKKILDRYKGKIGVEDKIRGDTSQGSNFIVLIPEGVK